MESNATAQISTHEDNLPFQRGSSCALKESKTCQTAKERFSTLRSPNVLYWTENEGKRRHKQELTFTVSHPLNRQDLQEGQAKFPLKEAKDVLHSWQDSTIAVQVRCFF